MSTSCKHYPNPKISHHLIFGNAAMVYRIIFVRSKSIDMVDVRFNPEELTLYKRRFNHQLEPIKVMLVNRKNEMTKEEWIEFIERTRKSVLDHPDQYLDTDMSNAGLMDFIINRIFDDFLDNFKLRQSLHR